MIARTKLAWGTLGLSLLVLFPFLAHIALRETVDYRDLTPVEHIAELIKKQHYKTAYKLARKIATEELTAASRSYLSYQQALCERALNRPEKAYARLKRLDNNLAPLEDYRRFWMAGALEEMDDPTAAISAYEDFLIASSHAALVDSAHIRLANLYVTGKQYDDALRTYHRLQERTPTLAPELLHRTAAIYDLLRDHAAARKQRLKLIQHHPGHSRALEALAHLRSSKSPEELHARAQVYYAGKRYRQTISACNDFLRKYPGHHLEADAHYLRARAYVSRGDYARAQREFTDSYKRYQRPGALYRIAGIQVRRNRDSQAIATYKKLADLHPQHELANQALWNAAKASERHNNFEQAEIFYLRLVENYPQSKHLDEARWNVGFTYYCRHQYKKALQTFQKVSRLAEEPHIVDQSLFWAGKSAAQLDLDDEAQIYYSKAAQGFPRSYYSSRAVRLGFAPSQFTQTRPPARIEALPTEPTRIKGGEAIDRAHALHQLGLATMALAELRRTEKQNKGDIGALKVVRFHYEDLGFLNRALALSVGLFTGADADDIRHVYPAYYWDEIVAATREAKIDPYLVASVIRQESYFNKDAISRAGAMGLMQIMPQTGRTLARQLGLRNFDRHTLFDPLVSIRLGSRFLGDQVRRFTEGPTEKLGFELGLAAYNAGPHIARKWIKRFSYEDPDTFIERIPYKETRHYVKLVLKNYTIYKALSQV